MNRTSNIAVKKTLKIQRTADAKQLGLGPVPAPKHRPTIARLREAMTALHVHGTARALAFELLSYWQPGGSVFPSLRTLSAGLGVEPRTVRSHLARLKHVGLWVRVGRTGRTNLYELRLPGPVPVLGENTGVTEGRTPDPTIRGGRIVGSAISNQGSDYVQPHPALPDHLEAIEGGHGLKCRRCDHSWPAVKGRAHLCVSWREKTHRTRVGMVRPKRDSDVRSRKIDQARRKWKRIESIPK